MRFIKHGANSANAFVSQVVLQKALDVSFHQRGLRRCAAAGERGRPAVSVLSWESVSEQAPSRKSTELRLAGEIRWELREKTTLNRRRPTVEEQWQKSSLLFVS